VNIHHRIRFSIYRHIYFQRFYHYLLLIKYLQSLSLKDKAGNRITSSSLRAEGEAISSYTHNANNEMTAVINDQQSALSYIYQYDQNGNLTQQTQGTQQTIFIYNSSDRLERVELPGGVIVTYTYDPFGRRIKKDINGQVTYYMYANEGLIGEYDSTGNLQKAYGWIPNSIWGTNPVFMLQNGNYYYYHNDHLGTPQKMTNEAGNVVWSTTYTALGEATVEVAMVTNNLRFPGQYYDAETGKHYNWNRYYDTRTGRYISEDPIGLAGGINLYLYVGNDPINWIDPWGLEVVSGVIVDVLVPAGPNASIIATVAAAGAAVVLSAIYGVAAPIAIPVTIAVYIGMVMATNFMDEDCFKTEEYQLHLLDVQRKEGERIDRMIAETEKSIERMELRLKILEEARKRGPILQKRGIYEIQ